MNSVEKTSESSYAQNKLKDVLKSLRNDVRVLIIYTYWLSLEQVSLILKDENMEREYAYILASDNSFHKKKAKYFQNLLIFTVVLPNLNEEVLVVDFDDPMFKGMANSSADIVSSTYAGKHLFANLKK